MTTSANAPAIAEATIRELSQRHGEPAWLLDRRLAALRAYDAMSMPDPLEEEWRRTDLSGFNLTEALSHTKPASIERVSESLPAGVLFGSLHDAATQHSDLLQEHLHSLVKATEWKLSALQAASWQDGAFVYVPRGVELAFPLRYFVKQNGAPVYPHLLIVAEANSSVTVVHETTGQSQSGYSLVNGAVEIIARPDSRVRYVDLQGLSEGGAYNFSTVRARLERGAEFSAATISLGGRLSRTKLEVSLEGEGSHAELLGLALGDGKQHFDYITLQDHTGPRTSSDLLFKAALDGASSMVWNGIIRIQKGASASQANQTSRNLLLSDRAKAAPIPVLEIEAHDVLQCSHGASAGPLDEEQRFYLESRGIPPEVAEQLLVEAFFREVIDRLPEGIDKDALAERILAKIGVQS
jgi:Fe-S cluster assembly protein SufD